MGSENACTVKVPQGGRRIMGKEVEKTREETREEKGEFIENAGIKLDDAELEMVSGGAEEDYPWDTSIDPLLGSTTRPPFGKK